ncbi:MAG: hypothetical protein WCJ30_22240, partial [Deltaproteobacteria bacterium]
RGGTVPTMSRREPRLTQRARKASPPGRKMPADLATSPDMRTMSDVLAEWAAPILEPWEAGPIKLYRNGLKFASLIWNFATASDAEPAGVVDQIFERLASFGIPAPATLRHIVEALVESRRADYAHDTRIVILPKAFDVGGKRKVEVASEVWKG